MQLGILGSWAPAGLGARLVPTPLPHRTNRRNPLPSLAGLCWLLARAGRVLCRQRWQIPGARELESWLLPGGPSVPGKALWTASALPGMYWERSSEAGWAACCRWPVRRGRGQSLSLGSRTLQEGPAASVSPAHREGSVPQDPRTGAAKCVDDKIKTIFFYVGRRSRDKFGK